MVLMPIWFVQTIHLHGATSEGEKIADIGNRKSWRLCVIVRVTSRPTTYSRFWGPTWWFWLYKQSILAQAYIEIRFVLLPCFYFSKTDEIRLIYEKKYWHCVCHSHTQPLMCHKHILQHVLMLSALEKPSLSIFIACEKWWFNGSSSITIF